MNEYKVLKKFGEYKKGDIATFTEMTVEEVEELIEAGKIALVSEDENDEEEAEEVTTSSKGAVIVTWNGGSREYSKEVHGKDYKALAEEFASKHPTAVIS